MSTDYNHTAVLLYMGEDKVIHLESEGLAGVSELQQHPLEVRGKH